MRQPDDREEVLCVTTRVTRGIYSMSQVYLQVTILVETGLISTIYHQPLLYVVLQ